MPHLRLVTAADSPAPVDDRPRVSLRLLMAASGRCSCDDCLLAYRAGDRSAGIVRVGASAAPARLTAVR
ncbi:MAG: hypothetical protein JO222_14755 [Frankiales bacterium]|nr:hypothetical protein [Frankiales bacterium]